MAPIQAKRTEEGSTRESQMHLATSGEKNMGEAGSTKYLRIALLLVGLIFVVGIYPLTIIWPSGWSWHAGQSDYLQMILGIYATLGIFLLIASRNPLAHLSLIWFTVWSSVVHGGIMAVQALTNSEHMGHLWGDVLALLVVAAVLAFLTPRGVAAKPVG
jgi:hypothetical protein